jgi:hypothetical protein
MKKKKQALGKRIFMIKANKIECQYQFMSAQGNFHPPPSG